MSANTTPIFTLTPRNAYITTGTSANTNLDGTGTVATVVTAGTNGSYINRVRITHLGTNVATVVRLFVNNGSTNTTASNNALVYEVAIPANTLSQTAASTAYDIPLDLRLAASYKINATIGTACAAGLMVAIELGDY